MTRLPALVFLGLSLSLGACSLPGEIGTGKMGDGPQARSGKVPVCHRGRTIRVDGSAVRAHLRHGDHRGACRR